MLGVSSFDLVTRCAYCGVTDEDGQAPALAGEDVARGVPPPRIKACR